MARARSVHPSWWTDEEFVANSPLARLLLIGLANEADDYGVFAWKPMSLKMRILPADSVDVADLLSELESNNRVLRFDDSGGAYGAIKDFCKFQRPKSPMQINPLPTHLYEYVGHDGLVTPSGRGARREWLDARAESLSGDSLVCAYCGNAEGPFHVDHIHPRALGGSNDPSNLAVACASCNCSKGAKPLDEWLTSRGSH